MISQISTWSLKYPHDLSILNNVSHKQTILFAVETVEVNFSQCLVKRRAVKVYGEMEVEFRQFLAKCTTDHSLIRVD
jgi:hypothetical protein